MKTIFQKDLRENLKLALIGFAIFTLLLIQAYQSSISTLARIIDGNWSGRDDALQPLLSNSLLTEAAFFCAIFGAALGWLQTRNEAHRDLWAFLVHRPVTRREIFRGKAAAGLCLYFFGAGLPLAILIAVVATPGHVAAPFEWEMTLPLLAILLSGIAFYFAGMLTGLRQARWYVSRSFGLGLALAAVGAVFNGPFSGALFVIAGVILVLATAACGSYQTGGFYRGLSPLGKFALITTLLAGCAATMFVAVGLLLGLVFDPLVSYGYTGSSYQMTRDGTIYKTVMHAGYIAEITDLDGHPLMDPKTGQKMERNEFQKIASSSWPAVSSHKNREASLNIMLGSGRFFGLRCIANKTLWYLDRHGKLTGYDAHTRKFVGTLDAHGTDGTQPAEDFLRQPSGYYYYNSYDDAPQKLLPTAKSVYLVDFKERTVKPVFTLTNDDAIGGFTEDLGVFGATGEKKIFITTRKIVSFINSKGQPAFTLPYEPGYSEYPHVAFSILAPHEKMTNSVQNNFAVWFHPDGELNQKSGWQMPIHVLWLGPEQTVTKKITLPSTHQPQIDRWPDRMAAALLPPPMIVSHEKSYGVSNLLSCALAIVCAFIGWTLSRRYNFSTKASVGWTLFCLLLGVAGLLTFLCVQEFPAREECPGCKKLRAVDRENCEHCDLEFSPPEKNGTEIFAPLV